MITTKKNINPLFGLIVMAMFATATVHAQSLSISGPSNLVTGQSATYSLSGFSPSNASIYWTVHTGGQITPSPYSSSIVYVKAVSGADLIIQATVNGFAGGSASKTILVFPPPPTPILSSATQPTCTVTTGSFTITNYDSTYTYSVSPSSGTSISGNTVTALPGSYTVRSSIPGTAVSQPSVSRTINPQPTTLTPAPVLSPATHPTCTVATGSFTITNYNSSYTYSVSPSSGTSISGSTVTAPPGSYTVTATLGSCTSSASRTINARPTTLAATPVLGPATHPTCTVATGSFTITNYNGSYTYSVSPSSGTSISGSTVTAPPGSYTVTATLGNCTSSPSASRTINARPTTLAPAPVLSPATHPTCAVATGSFTITNYNGSYTYSVSPSSGTSISGSTVTAPPGSYTVTATLGNCTSPASASTTINAQPSTPSQPTLSAPIQPSCSLSTGSFTITNHDVSYTYSVNPSLGTTVSGSSVIAPPGDYTVIAFSGPCASPESTSITIDAPPSNCEPSDPLDQNYVYSREYQEPSLSVIDAQFFTGNDAFVQNITYFDGLGRPIQQIAIDQTPAKNDIVTFMDYDDYARMNQEFLAYPENDGSLGTYRPTAESNTVDYYNQEKYQYTQNPFSEKTFEFSPLNRVLKQAAPGASWAKNNGHEIEFDYSGNTSGDNVKQYFANTVLTTVNGVHQFIPTLEISATNGGNYNTGTLNKTVVKDENHTTGKLHTTEEFTDKQGRVVLKRTYALINGSETPHDTYYVYDDYGNLTYVLPPKMDASTATLATIITKLPELGYQYVYDHRNRLVQKTIPGKDEEYIIYNTLDQPVLTQDANLRENNEWLFTKYDAFGRVVYTGIYTNTAEIGRANMQSALDNYYTANTSVKLYENRDDAQTGNHNYSNTAFPNANTEILTVNYYDSYGFAFAAGTNPGTVFTKAVDLRTKGLATGSKVKVLDQSPEKWINTVSYYDDKGRPIYTYSENEYLQTVDIVQTELDFVGKPNKVKTTHVKDGSTIVTIDNFTYDHVGRLLTQTQCIGDATMGDSCPTDGGGTGLPVNLPLTGTVTDTQIASKSITVTNATLTPGAHLYISEGGSNGNQELIVYNEYDELGQLKGKKVGGIVANTYANTQGLQTVDYTYNVRGWLKNINEDQEDDNDLFNFTLRYNNPTNGTALYNGNISQSSWHTQNTDASTKTYTYEYDALNRILAATGGSNTNFDVTGITYDKNGNIGKLNRQGNDGLSPRSTNYGEIDKLDYQYNTGNKLLSVTDTATNAFANEGFKDGNKTGADYTYDDNGNMISDANKGIDDIQYNHLNLPTKVTVSGNDNGIIDYVYDATGVKLEKIVSTGNATQYAGNYIYENGNLQFFNHAEGTVSPKNINDYSQGFDYVYNYTDHLGNVRLSYTDANGDGDITTNEIVEENNYYPFGLKHKGYNNNVSPLGNSVAKKFKYNGKELQDDLGLNIYDYGARNYDAAIGRFIQIDPLTEDYISQSVYVYAANNPTFFQEKNGESPFTIYVNEQGEQIADIDDGSDAVYVVSAENENALVNDLFEENVVNDNQDADTNAAIGEKHGFNITELKFNQEKGKYPKNPERENMDYNTFFEKMYKAVYTKNKSEMRKNSAISMIDAATPGSTSDASSGVIAGQYAASRNLREGKMNMFNPEIKSAEPKYNFGSMIGNARSARAAAQSSNTTYTIQRGDNLTGIANANNTTVGSLVKLNNIKTPNHIEAGATIKIKQ